MSTTRANRRARTDRPPAIRANFEGLVIDDKPFPLSESLPKFMERKGGLVPRFRFLTGTKHVDELDAAVRAADIILLDHVTGSQFKGFRNGLSIGEHIVRMRADVPIYYYSAFNALLDGATDAKSSEIHAFTKRHNVHVFDKGDLTPGRRLPELYEDIQKQLQGKLEEAKHMTIKSMQQADVIGRERRRFRIDNFDRRRKYQEVRNLEDAYAPTIEVATSILRGLSLNAESDIIMEVCEFSSGHVVSSFTVEPRRIAPEVLEMLERADDEAH